MIASVFSLCVAVDQNYQIIHKLVRTSDSFQTFLILLKNSFFQMLGFNDLRFFELIQTDFHQFRCDLCLGLLNKPLETKCCRKTYCKECITFEINKNGFCLTIDNFLESMI